MENNEVLILDLRDQNPLWGNFFATLQSNENAVCPPENQYLLVYRWIRLSSWLQSSLTFFATSPSPLKNLCGCIIC